MIASCLESTVAGPSQPCPKGEARGSPMFRTAGGVGPLCGYTVWYKEEQSELIIHPLHSGKWIVQSS